MEWQSVPQKGNCWAHCSELMSACCWVSCLAFPMGAQKAGCSDIQMDSQTVMRMDKRTAVP